MKLGGEPQVLDYLRMGCAQAPWSGRHRPFLLPQAQGMADGIQGASDVQGKERGIEDVAAALALVDFGDSRKNGDLTGRLTNMRSASWNKTYDQGSLRLAVCLRLSGSPSRARRRCLMLHFLHKTEAASYRQPLAVYPEAELSA